MFGEDRGIFGVSLKYSDDEYKLAKIDAHPSFWVKSNEDRKGGCGAGEGWGEKLVPDTIYLLPVRGVCHIHDHDYLIGETAEDKASGDRRFLNNLCRWIRYKTLGAGSTKPRFRWLRRKLCALMIKRARKYYWAVKYGGGAAFWDSKNEVSK